MKIKKLLIVSRAFHPINSPRGNRTTELVKELCLQGHSVHVICPIHPEQVNLIEQYQFGISSLGPLWPDIPVQLGGSKPLLLRALRRGMLQLFEYPNIQLKGRVDKLLRQFKDFDAVISIAAPHPIHWGVASALRKQPTIARTWIADCGDPFMGLENDSFRKMPYFAPLERSFCAAADFITIPNEESKDAYYREYREKIRVIPQGFKFSDYSFLKELGPTRDGVTRFAYAGLFIPGRRDPRPFLDILLTKNIDFEFNVYTPDDTLLRKYAAKDARIRLHGFIDRISLLKELATMDFLLNFEYPGRSQTPSKLIDYWLCGRPILSLQTNHINEGIIEEFMSGDYHNAFKVENPEHFDVANVAHKFDELIEAALSCKQAS